MCDCHEKLAEKLNAMIESKIKKTIGFRKVVRSYFENQSFLIKESGYIDSVPFCLPFIVEYERKAKSTGKVRIYKESVKFIPPYCPICGEQYDRTSPPK